jgi:LuxR family transcriptional regulator
MNVQSTLTHQLQRLKELAPGGYAIGLHVRFTTPSYMFQTYPKAWLDIYSREGLLMLDPAVAWAFQNEGMVRWTDLASEDSARVFARAESFGLVHGMTISVRDGGSMSIGGFARSDRFFTDDEVAEVTALLRELHRETGSVEPLPEGVREELRRMSVAFTHP